MVCSAPLFVKMPISSIFATYWKALLKIWKHSTYVNESVFNPMALAEDLLHQVDVVCRNIKGILSNVYIVKIHMKCRVERC
jgi:hypothetical protein